MIYLCSAKRASLFGMRGLRTEMSVRKMKRSIMRLVLFVAVLMLSAVGVVSHTEQSSTQQSIESILREVDHERNWLSERTTRTALPAEFSSRLMPPTVRTTVWRSRTQSSCTPLSDKQLSADVFGRMIVQSQGVGEGTICSSRAVDYYIFALRHIII